LAFLLRTFCSVGCELYVKQADEESLNSQEPAKREQSLRGAYSEKVEVKSEKDRGKKEGNYSAKKIAKVLDTVFLIFFNLSRHRPLVTRHILAGALKLAERM